MCAHANDPLCCCARHNQGSRWHPTWEARRWVGWWMQVTDWYSPDTVSLLSNISSKKHHKLDSSGLLLIMWACVSPCWCGCCNLALPVVLFAEYELDDTSPCFSFFLCNTLCHVHWQGVVWGHKHVLGFTDQMCHHFFSFYQDGAQCCCPPGLPLSQRTFSLSYHSQKWKGSTCLASSVITSPYPFLNQNLTCQ